MNREEGWAYLQEVCKPSVIRALEREAKVEPQHIALAIGEPHHIWLLYALGACDDGIAFAIGFPSIEEAYAHEDAHNSHKNWIAHMTDGDVSQYGMEKALSEGRTEVVY